MPIVPLLCLLAVMVFLPSFDSLAQPAENAVSTNAELLPASSLFGEATVIRNIPYVANPTSQQNFDLFLPRNRNDRPLPLIVWIHGGAWMLGSKDWINVKYLVRHGYAIASVDYRFSPEARFPAQIQDCNKALNFILAHATNYGINPKQFVVGGGSAGGHLALLLGLARQERNFAADPTIKPLAILDFFGPADLNKIRDDLLSIQSEKGIEQFQDAGTKLLGAPPEQASAIAKVASPVTYVSAASPPVLIVHGGMDELVPAAQSRRMHDALDQAGIKNELIMVDSVGHDGPIFSTPEIESKVVAFLTEILSDTRTNYPAHWWTPVPTNGAPAWEILPQAAAPGEVILSKRNELGLLSNFAPTPFTFHGKRYASLEGFWQMMKYPEGADDPRATFPGLNWAYTRDQVSQLTAFDAKKAGDLGDANMNAMGITWVTFEGRRLEYRFPGQGEFYQLIVAATREKVRQNPDVQKVLLAPGDLVLKPDHHQETNAPAAWRYYEILTQIRTELERPAKQ